jgi:predicted  nucleic acid-binding Zn ribbon protein
MLKIYRNAKNSNAFKEAIKTFWQSCKQLQMQLQPQMMHGGHHFAQSLAHRNTH